MSGERAASLNRKNAESPALIARTADRLRRPFPGRPTRRRAGDADLSGSVDGTDYALIDNAFNGQGGPLGGLANVPEPSTMLLALLGVAGAFVSQVLRCKRGTATAWLRV